MSESLRTNHQIEPPVIDGEALRAGNALDTLDHLDTAYSGYNLPDSINQLQVAHEFVADTFTDKQPAGFLTDDGYATTETVERVLKNTDPAARIFKDSEYEWADDILGTDDTPGIEDPSDLPEAYVADFQNFMDAQAAAQAPKPFAEVFGQYKDYVRKARDLSDEAIHLQIEKEAKQQPVQPELAAEVDQVFEPKPDNRKGDNPSRMDREGLNTRGSGHKRAETKNPSPADMPMRTSTRRGKRGTETEPPVQPGGEATIEPQTPVEIEQGTAAADTHAAPAQSQPEAQAPTRRGRRRATSPVSSGTAIAEDSIMTREFSTVPSVDPEPATTSADPTRQRGTTVATARRSKQSVSEPQAAPSVDQTGDAAPNTDPGSLPDATLNSYVINPAVDAAPLSRRAAGREKLAAAQRAAGEKNYVADIDDAQDMAMAEEARRRGTPFSLDHQPTPDDDTPTQEFSLRDKAHSKIIIGKERVRDYFTDAEKGERRTVAAKLGRNVLLAAGLVFVGYGKAKGFYESSGLEDNIHDMDKYVGHQLNTFLDGITTPENTGTSASTVAIPDQEVMNPGDTISGHVVAELRDEEGITFQNSEEYKPYIQAALDANGETWESAHNIQAGSEITMPDFFPDQVETPIPGKQNAFQEFIDRLRDVNFNEQPAAAVATAGILGNINHKKMKRRLRQR